jgi:hypothetical protein
MEIWPIIKLTLVHCGVGLAISVIFGATLYICGLIYGPVSVVVWWLSKIDLMLAIITPTALGIIFLSSLFRIVLDAIVSTWKGFPNVHTIIALV